MSKLLDHSQIQREKGRESYNFEVTKQSSLLQYAVLSGQPEMIKLLLEEANKEGKTKKKGNKLLSNHAEEWLNKVRNSPNSQHCKNPTLAIA